MGGCATKPKVLKSDEAEIPAPAPDSATNKEVVVVEEGEKMKEGGDVVGVVIDEAGKVKEIVVEEDKVVAAADDDLETKPRSLSNLFKSEEEQDSTAFEKAPSKPLKEETKEFEEAPSMPLKEETTKEFEEGFFEEAPSEPLKKETKEPEKPKEEPEKLKEVSESMQPEVEKQVAELPLSPTFVDAPEKAITEKAQEATPAAVTEINESPEKKIEEAK